LIFLENQLKVGSRAAKKNKKRNSKKLLHCDEAVEKETVDFQYMLTELKKQLEEAKFTKVLKCMIAVFLAIFLQLSHKYVCPSVCLSVTLRYCVKMREC